MPNSRLRPRTTERGVTWPLLTSASSVENFIPGAAGLRACKTYHGPMRAFVACRVAAVSSIVQREHGSFEPLFCVPQNGQTCLPASVSRTNPVEGTGAIGAPASGDLLGVWLPRFCDGAPVAG